MKIYSLCMIVHNYCDGSDLQGPKGDSGLPGEAGEPGQTGLPGKPVRAIYYSYVYIDSEFSINAIIMNCVCLVHCVKGLNGEPGLSGEDGIPGAQGRPGKMVQLYIRSFHQRQIKL